MDCTIAICTRNRAESLRHTLGEVIRQEHPAGALEVLVVDNGSHDHTRQVVDAIGGRDPRVRYVLEPAPGLSTARNRAVSQARGEVLAFIDDDAWPERRDWAARLTEAYADPDVAAAGSDIDLVWPDGGQPSWLHDALLPCLAKTSLRLTETTRLTRPHGLWGANLSFRRGALLPPHGFRTHLGHAGARRGAGEEVEMCERLERAGACIMYVADARVLHAVAPARLSADWFRRRAWELGHADAAIDRAGASHGHLWKRAPRRLADATIQLGATSVLGVARAHRLRLWSQFRLRYSAAYLLGLVRR